MATLESLKLSGWKSIKETDPPITFGRLNVLVGANGAGKSNLVSLFGLFDALANERFRQFVARVGGADTLLHFGSKHTKTIRIQARFRVETGVVDYSGQLQSTAANGLMFEREEVVFPSSRGGGAQDDTSAQGTAESLWSFEPVRWQPTGPREVVALLQACHPYHFHDTTEAAAVRRTGYIEDNRRLHADAGNLAAVLYVYRQTRPAVYRRILGTIRQVAPFLDDFVLEPRRLNPREIQLDWRAAGSDYLLGPHQLSDGTLRMVALAALLLQPEADLPPLIVLDEPELGLHPAALGILAGLLKQAAVHAQVLVATQSATLLDHFEPEDVIVVDSRDGVSSFRRLDPEPYREWIEEYGLSDLWERNVIGGGPYQ